MKQPKVFAVTLERTERITAYVVAMSRDDIRSTLKSKKRNTEGTSSVFRIDRLDWESQEPTVIGSPELVSVTPVDSMPSDVDWTYEPWVSNGAIAFCNTIPTKPINSPKTPTEKHLDALDVVISGAGGIGALFKNANAT